MKTFFFASLGFLPPAYLVKPNDPALQDIVRVTWNQRIYRNIRKIKCLTGKLP
jgi:hypothetical protein